MQSCLSRPRWAALVVLGLIFTFASPAVGQQSVSVTLLSPASCVRSAGRPNTCSYTFPALSGQAVLRVINGDSEGEHRTDAAIVRLNGQTVAPPSRFSLDIPQFEVALNVSERNTLSVEMRGAPGSRLTFQVYESVAADAAGPIGPEGGALLVADGPLAGLRIELPPGALETTTMFVIRAVQQRRCC